MTQIGSHAAQQIADAIGDLPEIMGNLRHEAAGVAGQDGSRRIQHARHQIVAADLPEPDVLPEVGDAVRNSNEAGLVARAFDGLMHGEDGAVQDTRRTVGRSQSIEAAQPIRADDPAAESDVGGQSIEDVACRIGNRRRVVDKVRHQSAEVARQATWRIEHVAQQIVAADRAQGRWFSARLITPCAV